MKHYRRLTFKEGLLLGLAGCGLLGTAAGVALLRPAAPARPTETAALTPHPAVPATQEVVVGRSGDRPTGPTPVVGRSPDRPTGPTEGLPTPRRPSVGPRGVVGDHATTRPTLVAAAPRANARPRPAAAPAATWKPPAIPRHYPHIRILLPAFAGNPMGDFEDRLLRDSVDVVVSNPKYVRHIHAVAPETPQLLYTNTSNLYLDLLLNWLGYADAHGLSRDEAFYHAARPVPFRGTSPSSQPVTWFWAVHRGAADLTRSAHGPGGRVRFGGPDEPLYLGYPERFREINVQLAAPAGAGWAAVLEYPTAVSASGQPAGWAALTPAEDTTHGLAASGRVTFDPPADWKPARLGSAGPLFVVRFRTTADGTPPTASTLLGRDYVGAHGTNTGTVPAFDADADANGDGYLDDAEYAHHAPGKEARFLYESRLFTPNYGQMRYATRPAGAGFRAWCVAYHRRMVDDNPLAGGLFMDNADGKPPAQPADVREPLTGYAEECGAVLHAVDEAIAPHFMPANVAGGGTRADPLVRQSPIYFEESVLRPLGHNWAFFEEIAGTVDRRAALTQPAPYAILDGHPLGGAVDDPRTQLGVLAYYYLLADPDSTFLTIYGGLEPGTTWKRHWIPAVAYDVGRPAGKRSLFATGADPAKPAFSYRVYQRRYDKAWVLYKPLSFTRGGWREKVSTGDDSATHHPLGGRYRPLRADGTLGEPIDTVTLRNGEGTILIPTGDRGQGSGVSKE